MGGHDRGKTLNSVQVNYDATNGQWFKDDLSQPLYPSHSILKGDTVFVLGGHTKDNNLSTCQQQMHGNDIYTLNFIATSSWMSIAAISICTADTNSFK